MKTGKTKRKPRSNMGIGTCAEILLYQMAHVARTPKGEPVVMNTKGDMEPPNAATLREVERMARGFHLKAKWLDAWVRDGRARRKARGTT